MNRKSIDMLIALLMICVLALIGLLAVRYAGGDLAKAVRDGGAAITQEVTEAGKRLAAQLEAVEEAYPPLEGPEPVYIPPPLDLPPIEPLPSGYTPARPMGEVGTWFATDDYPEEAARRGWTGLVRFRWTIRADGSVTNCLIVQSSGHDILDAATCRILLERGRYEPARNTTGEPVESQDEKAVRWMLPDDEPGFFSR